jgi:hypothetical protein
LSGTQFYRVLTRRSSAVQIDLTDDPKIVLGSNLYIADTNNRTIHHPPSTIRHPPSAIRHPPSAILKMVLATAP